MYESHWLYMIQTWQEQPATWRSRALDEILNGRGVPPNLRASLWLEASGAKVRMEQFPNVYQELLLKASELIQTKNEDFLAIESQIRKDIRRTFPLFFGSGSPGRRSDSPFLDTLINSKSMHDTAKPLNGTHDNAGADMSWKPCERALYRVICAVSLCIDNRGYHQSISFLAGLLLILFEDTKKGRFDAESDTEFNELVSENDSETSQFSRGAWDEAEEPCFWVLHCMMTDYHLQGIYEHKSSFLQQYVDRFAFLVRQFLPRLHHHLLVSLSPNFPIVLFSIEWFTTLFSYVLRLETTHLVWDLFLVARLDETLYVVGLAVLLHLYDKVLELHTFEKMMTSFKKLVFRIEPEELRASIGAVVRRIVPSALIPPGRSTLAIIEREIRDHGNIFNTPDFNAMLFARAVQLNDVITLEQELRKYKFPVELLEQGLLRSCFLGHSEVALRLLNYEFDALCCNLLAKAQGLTPLHVAALMGNPTLVRVLLHRGKADKTAICYLDSLCRIDSSVGNLPRRNGLTALDLSEALRRSVSGVEFSAVSMVLLGEVCLYCGKLLKKVNSKQRSFVSVLGNFAPRLVFSQWKQAVERCSKRNFSFPGDYCVDCSNVLQQYIDAKDDSANNPKLDEPIGSFSWYCSHCRTVIIRDKSVQCMRCRLSFCVACTFTKRRLLPSYKHPVNVCQNCHHFLRSCPCVSMQGAVRTFDVMCDHATHDYLGWGDRTHLSPSKPSDPAHLLDIVHPREIRHCSCRQCLKRRYRLKAPLLRPRPLRYDPDLPLFSFPSAVSHGFWGYDDRSILSVSQIIQDPALQALQQIEDFCMSKTKFSNVLGKAFDNHIGSCGGSADFDFDTKGSEDNVSRIDSLDDHCHVPRATYVVDANKKDTESNDIKLTAVNGIHVENDGKQSLSHSSARSFRDFRSELREFYEVWNPSQLDNIESILQEYRGREDTLLRDLNKMYISSNNYEQ